MAEGNAEVGALRVSLGLESASFTQSMQDITRKIKGLNSEFQATAAGNKDFEKSLDGMKAKSGQLTSTLQLQEQRVKQLRAEYERSVQEKGKDSKATENLLIRYNSAVAAMKRTENALSSVGKELDDAQNKWKQFGKSATEAGDKMKNIGGGMKNIGAGMTAGMTTSLLGFGAAAMKAASDVESSQATIQNQLGISSGEAAKLNESAQKLWKQGFGQSMDEVANGITSVSKNMKGLDPSQIEASAKSALTVAELMGTDVNEVTRTASQLMKDFGVSSTEAFDLITKGQSTTINQNGDMLDVLKEYSPQFKALGFSGSEFFNTLQAGADAGAFSMDKVGDAVKEFNIRAKDGSEGTAEAFNALGFNAEEMSATLAAGGPNAQKAFQQVVSAIGGIEDPLKRNQIGVALFGTQFEDLESDVVTALGKTSGEFDNVAGATENARKVVEATFGERMQTLGRGAAAALTCVGSTFSFTEAITLSIEGR